MKRCDFCYEPDPEPAWDYPAADFDLNVAELGLTDRVSGAWLACRPCHDLIERDDYPTLAARSTDEHIRRRTEASQLASRFAPGQYRASLLEALTGFHQSFKASRTGPAKRVPPASVTETRPEFVAAMERQLEWLTFERSPECSAMWASMQPGRASWDSRETRMAHGERMRDHNARDAYRRVLEYGDVFYVSKPISQLIHQSARTLPDATFHMTLLPAPTGFVVFEEPIELPPLSAARVVGDIEGVHRSADVKVKTSVIDERAEPKTPAEFPIFFSAMGWTPTDDGGAEFVLFTDSTVIHRKGYWPLAYFGFKDGDSWRDRVGEFEQAAAEDDRAYADPVPHEITFAMSLLLFVNQRVLVQKRAAMPRSTRRRAERVPRRDPALNTHVQVITLRRYGTHSESAEDHAVEWHFQWAVRGHWRQQPYKTQGVVRPIWIAPFTKGPEGKPFKEAGRIFAVTR